MQITLTAGLFALCAVVIVLAGVRLSRYGAIIAEKTGMGGTWTGVVLMAAVTFAMRTIFVFERAHLAEVAEKLTGEIPYADITLRHAIAMFGAAAAVLVSAALLLPGAASELAAQTGLGESFVGSLFVAASTSLPEVAVSVAAARLGALDMAAGNLFGSILFNIGVLGVDDLLYTSAPILAAVSPAHVVSLAGAMTMMSIAIIGLTYRARKKRFRLSWDALGIVAIYAMTIALLKSVSS